jgi:AraC-like DNA-binding protein
VLIGALSISILYAVLVVSGRYRDLPQLIGVIYPFPFLYGPLWYLYTRTLTSSNAPLYRKDLLHFIPFLNGYCILFPYLLESGEWKVALMDNPAERLPALLAAGNLLMAISGITYLVLTVLLLRRHLRRLLDFFSDIDNVSLRWLRTITLIHGAIWIVVACLMVLRLFGVRPVATAEPVVVVGVSFLVFAAGYLGLRQREIFEPVRNLPGSGVESQNGPVATAAVPGGSSSATSYRKSGLSEERKAEILSRLTTLLENEKPYLKSTLTLKDLADSLSVSEHNLSEVINSSLGQTFFDLVNSYRVREVQERLKSGAGRKFTLVAIAFDSGFNSKSSFNSIFKRHTGRTPSNFKRDIQEN